jgi:hypothetical protein
VLPCLQAGIPAGAPRVLHDGFDCMVRGPWEGWRRPAASPGALLAEFFGFYGRGFGRPAAAKLERLEAENAAAMDAEDYDRADKLAAQIAAIEKLQVRPAPAQALSGGGRKALNTYGWTRRSCRPWSASGGAGRCRGRKKAGWNRAG